MYEGNEYDKNKQLLHISKCTCDFCEKSVYFLVMSRDVESGEPLLVCEECATSFGGDWKNIKDK